MAHSKIFTAASIGYSLLLQELARMSTYFCERAIVGDLVSLLLKSCSIVLVTEVSCVGITYLLYVSHFLLLCFVVVVNHSAIYIIVKTD